MARSRLRVGAVLLACGGLLSGCTTGEGTGEVWSDHLFVRNCHDGPFDLGPTFFGSNPYQDVQTIRVQRSDHMEAVADGLAILVTEVARIRGDDGGGGLIDQDVRVGLPRGVAPPGQVVEYDPDPPPVSMALYLNDSCPPENSSLYAIRGTIRFSSLFSGDTRETRADDRLTEAEFTAEFADPRDLGPGGQTDDPSLISVVSGRFRFFFHRGQPAQPFP